MVDALGFKGIWERFPADAVLERMHALRKSVEEITGDAEKALAGLANPRALPVSPKGVALFLSDTVIIALSAAGFETIQNERLHHGIPATMAAFVLKACGLVVAGGVHKDSIRSGAAPMNYRGAVTWGQFEIDGNFLLGPAVDEVAALHDRKPEGAMVLVTQAVVQRLNAAEPSLFPRELRPGTLILEYEVPFKNAAPERHWVLNPFAVCSSPSECHDVTDGIKQAFGEDGATKHASKYANTMSLLSAARRVAL